MDDDLSTTYETIALAQHLHDQATEMLDRGNYPVARSLFERALALQETVSGPAHPDTARCLNGLARTLEEQGEFGAARPVAERALSIRREALGDKHADVAESLHTLAGIVFDQGDFPGGQKLMEQAWNLRKEALGPDHPDTLESCKNLALMMAYQRNRAGAEPLLTHALEICERAFGEQHRTTAKVLNGLGVIWAADKRTYAKARSAYQRALAINEQLLGPEHLDTARSMNNLAAVLSDMGDQVEAQKLLERSLAIHEQVLGRKNPRLAFVLTNLADIYRAVGDPAAARPLLVRALAIGEATYGPRHPQTMRSLEKLVGVLSNLHGAGDPVAMNWAMPLYECLTSLKAAAGTLNPASRMMPGAHLPPDKAAQRLHEVVVKLEAEMDRPPLPPADQAGLRTAAESRERAAVLYDAGEYTEAQTLLEQALATQERILGLDHLDHVPLLEQLAKAREAQGHYAAVLPIAQRIADIHVKVLGPQHPQTLVALSHLMGKYAYEYGLAAARPIRQQLAQAAEEALGPDDPMAAMMRDSVRRIEALHTAQDAMERPQRSRSQKREETLADLSREKTEVLAGVDQIDWHSLHHAYGPADDVPRLLALLLSDDVDVQNDAWEALYSNVWHQGTVYEASAHVVPFMLRMLAHGEPPERGSVLAFLQAVAEGSSYLAAHAQGEHEAEFRESLHKLGRDLETDWRRELEWIEAANRAVGEGLDMYWGLLTDPDADIRAGTLGVLASLRGHSDEIVSRLQQLLQSEPDAGVQVEIVRALRALMDKSAESQAFWMGLMQPASSPAIKLLAAAALAERAGEATPEAAVAILMDALHGSKGTEVEDKVTALEGTAGLHLALAALTGLGPARAIPALLSALPSIQNGEEALEVAAMLLDLAFNGAPMPKSQAQSWQGKGDARRKKIEYWEPKPQPPRDRASLTAQQRRVLVAIAAHSPVWVPEHNLLRLYGLPATRDELDRFVRDGD